MQPQNADWLYAAGRAGEWIDPISHAHVNLVTGLTMLVAGSAFVLVPLVGGAAPSRRLANACFWTLLGGSLAFYEAALYLGIHEGHLVAVHGLSYEQARAATPIHPWLVMSAGVAMMAAFWLLLVTLARSFWHAPGPARPFVLAGCAALAVGTLQGPVQAFPAVDELLERGGDAGAVIVNLHAQLNMLGGLMVILTGLALPLLFGLSRSAWPRRTVVVAARAVPAGMAVYYLAGIGFAAAAAHSVAGGGGFGAAVARQEPWQALVLVPATLAVLAGFVAYAYATWSMTVGYRRGARTGLARAPAAYTGRIPKRVRKLSPVSLAAYEVPMGLLGFPGLGWLFAGFPFTATILLVLGPAFAWAVLPLAFSPFGQGPLRDFGWQSELVWLPLSTLASAALLYRAHRRRLKRLSAPPRDPTAPPHTRRRSIRARIAFGAGALALVLVSLPFVPAVTGLGSHATKYAYQPRLTREITGQFVRTPRGTVKLYAWRDPQATPPRDALRLHPADLGSLVFRAAAVDRPSAYRLYDSDLRQTVPLAVRERSATSLTLAPVRPLRPGRYMLIATHEGMFGGHDYAYMTVVPRGAPGTAIRAASARTAPAAIDALLPIAAAIVAALFAALLLHSLRRRLAAQKVLWACGFAFFAVAAASEALAQSAGWNAGLFRAYYTGGAILTVAYLGAGSAWLQLGPRARDLMVGALAVATLAAVATVLIAPVDGHALATTAGGRPPPNGAIGGAAAAWAVALNTFGTVGLIGGALRSILRRQRVRQNVWIASGALVLALSTSMSRAGDYSLMYVGELVGITAMFCGFALPDRARRVPRKPRPAPGAAVVH